jgi:endonuclease/exonuclease/phosphatase family metal-dependent hydrolase
MRAISYNILDGGEGRADPLAEVIEAQRADIVAIVEADNLDVLERIARRLRMDYFHAPGKRHAVALASRWPIVETINHSALNPEAPCLLEALVRSPAGVEWRIGVLHLHGRARDRDEEERLREIEVVLKVFEHCREGGPPKPYILTGDFNSNSPVQEIDPERCKPRTRDDWRENGGTIPREVIQRLLDTGHVDTLDALHPDIARAQGTFTTQFPGQRLDYFFTWGIQPGRVKGAWIEKDRLAKYASDHFPIGVEIADS